MTKRVKFQEKTEIKNERPKTGIYRIQSAGGRTRRIGSGRRKGKACLLGQLYILDGWGKDPGMKQDLDLEL